MAAIHSYAVKSERSEAIQPLRQFETQKLTHYPLPDISSSRPTEHHTTAGLLRSSSQ